ncbi:uncharacterized protein YprB with RNaseH-like and TPR domain [Alkalihalobacillus xiaoxiensis]|uniref:Uncharacterized protein YprB with RNaseH-like and TPR domain n=1 Tax=Shouchella xiaoxiensis TaxID=766895 RepID=A0ABS2SZN4_9BACI|nr:ribonuclease H-like domain-containing protein [Shouchella xiaoxiensis]MBM7840240.1 uncharacterized protein YprB with RNaseH-like and TPR domain [Shouchella xiaoxiensis]
MSIKSKLKRLEAYIQTPEPVNSNSQPIPNKPFNEAWSEIGASPYTFDSMICYIREKRYPLDSLYGKSTFRDMQAMINSWDTTGGNHPLSKKNIPSTQLIFFDTETTGLSSGAGTQMFLIGYAFFAEDEVIVRQFLLPSPEAEPALFYYFLTDVGRMDYLVSFNGKAFDWPRLKTRHALLRDTVPTLPKFGHFDLLHGSRRVWKHTLSSFKLSVIEEEKLGVYRDDDTPSHLVPLLYFDFVREGDPSLIKSVFIHHEKDLLSLMSLYATLTEEILNQETTAREGERFEVGRWYESVNAEEEAIQIYRDLIKEPHPLSVQAAFNLAKLLKKQHAYNEALVHFKHCLKNEYNCFECATELALINERYQNNSEQAKVFAYRALEEAGTEKERSAAIKRINRLEKRNN